MALRLGDTAPDFTAETTAGTISFHEYLGDSWGVLLSHPADFTPVCTTEIGRTAQLNQHQSWVKDINEVCNTTVDFPLIADSERKVAVLYDMIHPNANATATVRSVFIIGPDKKIRLTLTYPAAIGRNFSEIIRVLDALQLSAQHSVSTPADWENGKDVIISNTVSTEDALAKFPKGVTVVKSYLRYTPAPGKN